MFVRTHAFLMSLFAPPLLASLYVVGFNGDPHEFSPMLDQQTNIITLSSFIQDLTAIKIACRAVPP